MNTDINNIKTKLIENVIIEWFRNNKNYIFDIAYCSNNKCVRVTTTKLNSIFGITKKDGGIFKNKYHIMYEFYFTPSSLDISCSLSEERISKTKMEIFNNIVDGFKCKKTDDKYKLLYLQYTGNDSDLAWVIDALNDFDTNHLKQFERKLTTLKNKKKETTYWEGGIYPTTLNKYERNKEARIACLNYYGYKCQICNFDATKVYGDDFKGLIEVHHILPLSKIKKGYVVDPIKDLIPVCPNCHAALHHKKIGIYTPTELKELLNKERRPN